MDFNPTTYASGFSFPENTQIERDEDLSLFISETSGYSSDDVATMNLLYNNERIVADGQGGFTQKNILYYPEDGNNINIYAIHPYNKDIEENIFNKILLNPTEDNNKIPVSVQTDQSNVKDYLLSDLLYASQEGIAESDKIISLNFEHKFSRLDISVVANSDDKIANEKLESVSVTAIPSSKIELMTGDVDFLTDGTTTDIMVYGIPEGGASFTEQFGEKKVEGIGAIIVPQEVLPGSPLFNITIGGKTYSYNAEKNLNFIGGKSYQVKLKIENGKASLASNIEPWIDEDLYDGPATPDIVPINP